MIKPTININGTAAEDLRAEYLRAYEACRALEVALQEVTIHGRDYPHPQSGSRAILQHDERIAWVRGIRQDLCEMIWAIDAQVKEGK